MASYVDCGRTLVSFGGCSLVGQQHPAPEDVSCTFTKSGMRCAVERLRSSIGLNLVLSRYSPASQIGVATGRSTSTGPGRGGSQISKRAHTDKMWLLRRVYLHGDDKGTGSAEKRETSRALSNSSFWIPAIRGPY
eukprot:365747-Chlamydomonas_euryale.AAC.8